MEAWWLLINELCARRPDPTLWTSLLTHDVLEHIIRPMMLTVYIQPLLVEFQCMPPDRFVKRVSRELINLSRYQTTRVPTTRNNELFTVLIEKLRQMRYCRLDEFYQILSTSGRPRRSKLKKMLMRINLTSTFRHVFGHQLIRLTHLVILK